MGKDRSKRSDEDSEEEEEERRRRRSRSKKKRAKKDDDAGEPDHEDHKKKSKRSRSESNSSSDDVEEEGGRERSRRRHKERKRKKSRRSKRSSSKKERKRGKRAAVESSSSSSSSSSDSSSSSSSDDDKAGGGGGGSKKKVVVNERLLAKLSARGETLEERKARRAQKRAAQITSKFGYTAEENPFNDPNLHETFAWKKRDAIKGSAIQDKGEPPVAKMKTLEEIEKVRQRRKDREDQFEEMERIRAEESRMKELENYDEWARKEEEFHLQQQRQRSAIRLVEGREKPIDVLAKNILLFGSDQEKNRRAAVKYQERYNALDAVKSLEAEIEEPPVLLKQLKLNELEELMVDINAFIRLERESATFGAHEISAEEKESNAIVMKYWENLRDVAMDEIKYLKSGGDMGRHASMVKEVSAIFSGQSIADLIKMKIDIEDKLQNHASDSSLYRENGEEFDRDYWKFVLEQLAVHIAKSDLSDLHSRMLVRQLERLEKKREELTTQPAQEGDAEEDAKVEARNPSLPQDVAPDFGDLEEELGLSGEVDLHSKHYNWEDKYRPRKPRYFNRVKTGYDWNKYNQTHYDRDNPPPKTVQGYKFSIF